MRAVGLAGREYQDWLRLPALSISRTSFSNFLTSPTNFRSFLGCFSHPHPFPVTTSRLKGEVGKDFTPNSEAETGRWEAKEREERW